MKHGKQTALSEVRHSGKAGGIYRWISEAVI